MEDEKQREAQEYMRLAEREGRPRATCSAAREKSLLRSSLRIARRTRINTVIIEEEVERIVFESR
jgi:hypothetical protein